MVVMKFGGTSVESAVAIERVARIVSSRLKRSPVVVVSAMAKVTDQLVAMGSQAAAGECEQGKEQRATGESSHGATLHQPRKPTQGLNNGPRLPIPRST